MYIQYNLCTVQSCCPYSYTNISFNVHTEVYTRSVLCVKWSRSYVDFIMATCPFTQKHMHTHRNLCMHMTCVNSARIYCTWVLIIMSQMCCNDWVGTVPTVLSHILDNEELELEFSFQSVKVGSIPTPTPPPTIATFHIPLHFRDLTGSKSTEMPQRMLVSCIFFFELCSKLIFWPCLTLISIPDKTTFGRCSDGGHWFRCL